MISRKIFMTSGLLGLLPLLLVGCLQITKPTLMVEDLILEPGETGTLRIIVFNIDGLHVVQVGPKGALTFDPEVIQIRSIKGKSGFQVFASSIDNDEGKILFLAGYPGGGLSDGVILELEIQAQGPAGAKTSVELTQIDLMADEEGNEMEAFDLRGGTVHIGSINLR